MAKLSIKVQALLLCAAVATALVFAGCAPAGPTEAEQAQQANRAYMSQVNQLMEELNGTLDGFVDAVAHDDSAAMDVAAGNAKRVIDKLSALEPPEIFKDVQEQYAGATQKLSAALDDYIALYAEAKKAPEADYSARLAEVQKAYDEGIAALKAADDAVASK